ncbi:LIV-I protein F, partial [Dysosmobacter welbionis]
RRTNAQCRTLGQGDGTCRNNIISQAFKKGKRDAAKNFGVPSAFLTGNHVDQNGSVGLRLLCGGGACNGQPLLFQLLQQSGIFGGGQFVDQSPVRFRDERIAVQQASGLLRRQRQAGGLDREGGRGRLRHIGRTPFPGQNAAFGIGGGSKLVLCAGRNGIRLRRDCLRHSGIRDVCRVLVGLGCIGRGGGVLLNAVHVGHSGLCWGRNLCMGFRMVRHSGAAGAGQAGDGQHHDGTAG